MAKGEMNDFLKAFYRRLHTDAMDYDVLARLVDNKKKGLLTKEQETWFDPNDGFIVPDSDPQNALGYKAKDLPELNDIKELTKDELKKLYEAFAQAMAGMKTASADYTSKDGDAKKFVKLYVDEIGLFTTPKATRECKNSIQKLIDLLNEEGKTPEEIETIKNIKQVIRTETKKVDKDELMFEQPEDLEKLLTKCADGKYDSDTSVQNKIKQVARTLDRYLNSYSFYIEGEDSSTQKNKQYLSSNLGDGLQIIGRDDAFSVIEVTKKNLENFRDIYGSELLKKLYHNKDIREKFRKHDNKKITDKIDKAEGKISYQDPNSDDYVSPKTDDVLTPVQQIEKWATDTYNNSLKKYAKLRGDPLMFSPFATEICKALDKEKIKPTDGLPAVIEKAEAIKKRIPNKTVMEHLDWFLATMGDIKKKYPKALDGAWKNSKQMKCVITEIILKATGPNAKEEDMDKAKTAMEIMSVMKYGTVTSKVLDAMKDTDFTLFSDGKLSWNKNEGIAFITKAFDKSIKLAFEGVGCGATFINNQIFLHRIGFNDRDNENGPLAMRFNDERSRLTNKFTADQNATNDANALDTNKIDQDEKSLRSLNRHRINDSTIDAKTTTAENYKARMEHWKHQMDEYQQKMAQNQQAYDDYNKQQAIIDEYTNLGSTITSLQSQLDLKKDEIRTKRTQIMTSTTYKDPLTGQSMGMEESKEKEKELAEEVKGLHSEYNSIKAELDEKMAMDSDPDKATKIADAHNKMIALSNKKKAYESAEKGYKRAEVRYESFQEKHSKLNSNIEEFHRAKKEIDELNTNIDTRNAAMANWGKTNRNKVAELEDFWNFLQTGKTRTWSFNTKAAQKKFDDNKQDWFQNFVAQYGMAA